MKTNTLFKSAALALSLSLIHNVCADDKVGVVNLQRALQETKKGKAAKATLEKELEDKKKKVEAERTAIQKASDEFQKKSSVLSEKARNQKGGELQQRMASFQELVQKSQAEIQGREAEMTRPILEGLRTMIGDIAKKKSVNMVFEENTSGLLFAKEKVDITEDLIKAYDAKN